MMTDTKPQNRQSAGWRWMVSRQAVWPSVLVIWIIVTVIAVTAPAERTLGGANARLVYFHGALVWASLLAWFLACGVGIVAFLRRGEGLHQWGRNLGWVAALWWALYIPVSILAANATWANNSWNLTFLMEPRFLMAFRLMALMLVAIGVPFFFTRKEIPSLANIITVLVLVFALNVTERVLHPPAPIRDTEALRIQLAFGAMTALIFVSGLQLSRLGLILRRD